MTDPVLTPGEVATMLKLSEWDAVDTVIRAAREYSAFTHGNLLGDRYRAREEARDTLLDALAQLDHLRGDG